MTEKQRDELAIGDLSVRSLIERMGAETPAPGGGTAASIAGALAGALIRMTSSYSITVGEDSEESGHLLDKIQTVSDRLLELAEEDRRAYEAYQEIRGSENVDEAEEIQALIRSTDVPLEMHACCVKLLEHYAALRDRIKPAFQADVTTALSLLEVTANTAEELAEYNLQELPEGDSRDRLREALLSQKSEFQEFQSNIDI